MCKMHKRWVILALSPGNPLTAREILETMIHRRSCPTMNELVNYLAKYPEFKRYDIERDTPELLRRKNMPIYWVLS